eukprot:CAMPEP_0174306358 /NCGR_PEP_ID=MMETSP0810-20121108/396_1 /TAXON_ID=73025 ORGANISM="Eutreptiella gymnastica-like, Strain CCMP1594" /NCGR_SAMPLE_ID=MMETSP0810 /ASSEMBLY_ACC=CAM_ASM_000659 /LENGTH=327 /DNA_ID=CAMNT_0015413043 /DNA_START=277 /DNA_END=1261 /DNA_ORIENTATION=-
MKLFDRDIEPSDIEQGGVGNCWLMSAFACLAEYPGAIQRCFITKEYSVRGKYKVSIYDKLKGAWETMVVDDHFPCSKKSGQPLFAKPKDQELWVMIYEKAFAKYCGSYHGLSGGHSVWALNAMTGDPVFKLMKEADGTWRRFDLTYHSADTGHTKQRRSIGLKQTQEVYNQDRLFNILLEYNVSEACLAASSTAGKDTATNAKGGIVQGHAYSILKLKAIGDIRLIKLRNPWGGFEWGGNWSDKCPLWNQHPAVKRECEHVVADDGTFWMSLDDFVKHFRNVDVLDRTTGMQDLALNLYEEKVPVACATAAVQAAVAFGIVARVSTG